MANTAVATLQPIPYLMFNGNCEEAMNFYASVFGGKILGMTRAKDTPMASQMPEGAKDFVVNSLIELPGGAWLYGGDLPPSMTYEGIKGLNITMNISSVAEAERIFNALAEGGDVKAPFGPTFWAKAFGMCVDRFGTPWLINGELQQM